MFSLISVVLFWLLSHIDCLLCRRLVTVFAIVYRNTAWITVRPSFIWTAWSSGRTLALSWRYPWQAWFDTVNQGLVSILPRSREQGKCYHMRFRPLLGGCQEHGDQLAGERVLTQLLSLSYIISSRRVLFTVVFLSCLHINFALSLLVFALGCTQGILFVSWLFIQDKISTVSLYT